MSLCKLQLQQCFSTYSKLKAFADDKINMTETLQCGFGRAVNNVAVRPASLTHKNRRGRTKSVNVRPSGSTSCKIYMVDTNS